MIDSKGQEYLSQLAFSAERCGSIMHDDGAAPGAWFRELLVKDGTILREEFTCVPCHAIVSLAAEEICNR